MFKFAIFLLLFYLLFTISTSQTLDKNQRKSVNYRQRNHVEYGQQSNPINPSQVLVKQSKGTIFKKIVKSLKNLFSKAKSKFMPKQVKSVKVSREKLINPPHRTRDLVSNERSTESGQTAQLNAIPHVTASPVINPMMNAAYAPYYGYPSSISASMPYYSGNQFASIYPAQAPDEDEDEEYEGVNPRVSFYNGQPMTYGYGQPSVIPYSYYQYPASYQMLPIQPSGKIYKNGKKSKKNSKTKAPTQYSNFMNAVNGPFAYQTAAQIPAMANARPIISPYAPAFIPQNTYPPPIVAATSNSPSPVQLASSTIGPNWGSKGKRVNKKANKPQIADMSNSLLINPYANSYLPQNGYSKPSPVMPPMEVAEEEEEVEEKENNLGNKIDQMANPSMHQFNPVDNGLKGKEINAAQVADNNNNNMLSDHDYSELPTFSDDEKNVAHQNKIFPEKPEKNAVGLNQESMKDDYSSDNQSELLDELNEREEKEINSVINSLPGKENMQELQIDTNPFASDKKATQQEKDDLNLDNSAQNDHHPQTIDDNMVESEYLPETKADQNLLEQDSSGPVKVAAENEASNLKALNDDDSVDQVLSNNEHHKIESEGQKVNHDHDLDEDAFKAKSDDKQSEENDDEPSSNDPLDSGKHLDESSFKLNQPSKQEAGQDWEENKSEQKIDNLPENLTNEDDSENPFAVYPLLDDADEKIGDAEEKEKNPSEDGNKSTDVISPSKDLNQQTNDENKSLNDESTKESNEHKKEPEIGENDIINDDSKSEQVKNPSVHKILQENTKMADMEFDKLGDSPAKQPVNNEHENDINKKVEENLINEKDPDLLSENKKEENDGENLADEIKEDKPEVLSTDEKMKETLDDGKNKEDKANDDEKNNHLDNLPESEDKYLPDNSIQETPTTDIIDNSKISEQPERSDLEDDKLFDNQNEAHDMINSNEEEPQKIVENNDEREKEAKKDEPKNDENLAEDENVHAKDSKNELDKLANDPKNELNELAKSPENELNEVAKDPENELDDLAKDSEKNLDQNDLQDKVPEKPEKPQELDDSESEKTLNTIENDNDSDNLKNKLDENSKDLEEAVNDDDDAKKESDPSKGRSDDPEITSNEPSNQQMENLNESENSKSVPKSDSEDAHEESIEKEINPSPANDVKSIQDDANESNKDDSLMNAETELLKAADEEKDSNDERGKNDDDDETAQSENDERKKANSNVSQTDVESSIKEAVNEVSDSKMDDNSENGINDENYEPEKGVNINHAETERKNEAPQVGEDIIAESKPNNQKVVINDREELTAIKDDLNVPSEDNFTANVAEEEEEEDSKENQNDPEIIAEPKHDLNNNNQHYSYEKPALPDKIDIEPETDIEIEKSKQGNNSDNFSAEQNQSQINEDPFEGNERDEDKVDDKDDQEEKHKKGQSNDFDSLKDGELNSPQDKMKQSLPEAEQMDYNGEKANRQKTEAEAEAEVDDDDHKKLNDNEKDASTDNNLAESSSNKDDDASNLTELGSSESGNQENEPNQSHSIDDQTLPEVSQNSVNSDDNNDHVQLLPKEGEEDRDEEEEKEEKEEKEASNSRTDEAISGQSLPKNDLPMENISKMNEKKDDKAAQLVQTSVNDHDLSENLDGKQLAEVNSRNANDEVKKSDAGEDKKSSSNGNSKQAFMNSLNKLKEPQFEPQQYCLCFSSVEQMQQFVAQVNSRYTSNTVSTINYDADKLLNRKAIDDHSRAKRDVNSVSEYIQDGVLPKTPIFKEATVKVL